MMDQAISYTVAQFRDAIALHFGLTWPDNQAPFLADVVHQRAAHHQCSDSDYVGRLLHRDLDDQEWASLSEVMTVGETYFFRAREQLDALVDAAIPALVDGSPRRDLRLLSAGCASGEEAYTLAMLLRERGQAAGVSSWTILGIDINEVALRRAALGLYTAWSLREAPPQHVATYFTGAGRSFQLAAQIRSDVRFERRNLIEADPQFWGARRFDIIFCRNVLMYMTPGAARDVLDRIAHSLVPGGYLFLGSAETVRGLSSSFSLCQSHGAFYYRLGASSERLSEKVTDLPSGGLPSHSEDRLEWIEAIDQSSRRVAHLTGNHANYSPGQPAMPALPDAASGLAPASVQDLIDLVRSERFSEVAPAITRMHDQSKREPLPQVIGALAMIHVGDARSAKAACLEVLRADPASDLAEYLLGLCWELIGDPEQAIASYSRIIARTSTFTMAWVRMALVAQRRQDAKAASAHASSALAAIDGDADLHLTLFSGGLPRRAIAELCLRLVQGGGNGR
jgi:chemotaxis protein methyltransferase CheR